MKPSVMELLELGDLAHVRAEIAALEAAFTNELRLFDRDDLARLRAAVATLRSGVVDELRAMLGRVIEAVDRAAIDAPPRTVEVGV